MTITVVQAALKQVTSPTGGQSDSLTSAAGLNWVSLPTPGNAIIPGGAYYFGGGAAISSFTDSELNSFSIPRQVFSGTNHFTGLGLSPAIARASTPYVTTTNFNTPPSGYFTAWSALEVSGLAASPFDTSGVSTTPSSGNLTLTTDASVAQGDFIEVVVVGVESGSTCVFTIPAGGWTKYFEEQSSAGMQGAGFYRIVSGASLTTRSAIVNASNGATVMSGVIAVFKAAASTLLPAGATNQFGNPPARVRNATALAAAAFTAGALLLPVQAPLNTGKSFDLPPRAAAQPNRGYTQGMPRVLVGQDQQFAGPGDWQTYDYPNPQRPRRPVQQFEYTNNLLLATGAPVQPPPNSDVAYALPVLRKWQPDARGFTQGTDLQLIGLDQQFAGPGQWKSYDYPNPVRLKRVPMQFEYTNNLLLNNVVFVQPPLNTAMVYDLPPQPKWKLDARGFTLSTNLSLLAPPVFVQPPLNTAMVFDNPTRARARVPQFESSGLALRTAIVAARPFNQTNWPNPRGRAPTLQFHTQNARTTFVAPVGGYLIDASPSVAINTPYGMTAVYSDGAQHFYTSQQKVSGPNRFLGRVTAGAGIAEELSGTQATALLDAFTSTLKGVVPGSGGGTTNFLRSDGAWAPAPGSVGANPTASVGLTAVNGAATTFMRSDGAPAIDQAIAPTWTAKHVFTGAIAGAVGTTTGVTLGSGAAGYATLRLTAGGAPTDSKAWYGEVDPSGNFYIAMLNDAASTARTALSFARTGIAVTTMSYGNVTDLPLHYLYGAARVQGNGQVDVSLWKDGTPTVAGDFGLNNTSIGGPADGLVLAHYTGATGWRALWGGTKSAIAYGNPTDVPSHSVYGTVNVNGTFFDPNVPLRVEKAGQNAGLELQVIGATDTRFVAYNRTGAVYVPLAIDASTITVRLSGVDSFTFNAVAGSGGSTCTLSSTAIALPGGSTASQFVRKWVPVLIGGVQYNLPAYGP